MKKVIEIIGITECVTSRPMGFYEMNGALYISTFDGGIPMYCGDITRLPLQEFKETSSISENLLLKTIAVLQEPLIAKDLFK